jgi:hypothetical protein
MKEIILNQTKTRNRIAFLFTIVIASAFLTGCFDEINCIRGHGAVISEVRETGEFSKIMLMTSGNVYVRQSDETELIIEAQENILQEIYTYVNDDVLKIKLDQCVKAIEPIRVYISTPDITGFKITGSGNIYTQGYIDTDHIEFRITGSGKIYADSLTTNLIETYISGSGDIFITTEETVNNHYINITGSGNIFAFDAPTDEVEIDIIGSGNCNVHAISLLDVEIAGSGNIYYIGHPEIIQEITGSGKIKSRN